MIRLTRVRPAKSGSGAAWFLICPHSGLNSDMPRQIAGGKTLQNEPNQAIDPVRPQTKAAQSSSWNCAGEIQQQLSSICTSAKMSIRDVLSGPVLAFGVTGLLAGLLFGYWIVTTYLQYRKLRHIRGPWLASISPLWMFYYTCRGTLYLAVEDALKKYGKSTSHVLPNARFDTCQARLCASDPMSLRPTTHHSRGIWQLLVPPGSEVDGSEA